MSANRSVRAKTFSLVVLMVLCSSVGDIFLKLGMRKIGSVNLAPEALVTTFRATVTSGMIWLGILCLLSGFVMYLMVLSWADYSYVMPSTSFGYAVVALLSVLILRENVTLARWAGVLLICFGVTLVGRTEPRTNNRFP
ncbi:MAG TPA: EamA family transporter [Candidatus Dormibacteraeota bacterium]|nr:EamA family transporter [Candidatus Dormibacteraeota bacterium]